MARRRQLDPTAEAVPLDQRHARLVELLEGRERRLQAGDRGVADVRGQLAHDRHVEPRRQVAVGAPHQHGPDVVVDGRLLRALAEPVEHRSVHRVEDLGAVDGHDGHSVDDLVAHGLAHARHPSLRQTGRLRAPPDRSPP